MSTPEEQAAAEMQAQIEAMLALPPSYHAERQGPAQRAGIIACMVVTIIVIIARIYARVGFIKGFGWDDILMVVATVSLLLSQYQLLLILSSL